MEMLATKYNQKAELKDKELELRKMELEFQQKKYEAEAVERKAKLQLGLEERKAMLAILKDRLKHPEVISRCWVVHVFSLLT